MEMYFELSLKVIFRLLARGCHDAGIVHQAVEARLVPVHYNGNGHRDLVSRLGIPGTD